MRFKVVFGQVCQIHLFSYRLKNVRYFWYYTQDLPLFQLPLLQKSVIVLNICKLFIGKKWSRFVKNYCTTNSGLLSQLFPPKADYLRFLLQEVGLNPEIGTLQRYLIELLYLPMTLHITLLLHIVHSWAKTYFLNLESKFLVLYVLKCKKHIF